MPKYAVFDSTGTILRTLDVPAEFLEQQLAEGEQGLECDANPEDSINVATGEVIRGRVLSLEKLTAKPPTEPYIELRAGLYPNATEQFDMLYHDIESGAFGESARESAWFKRMALIKSIVPKGPLAPGLEFMLDIVKPATPGVPESESQDYMNEQEYLRKKKK